MSRYYNANITLLYILHSFIKIFQISPPHENTKFIELLMKKQKTKK
jgi:hypothetical protein